MKPTLNDGAYKEEMAKRLAEIQAETAERATRTKPMSKNQANIAAEFRSLLAKVDGIIAAHRNENLSVDDLSQVVAAGMDDAIKAAPAWARSTLKGAAMDMARSFADTGDLGPGRAAIRQTAVDLVNIAPIGYVAPSDGITAEDRAATAEVLARVPRA